jgi:hypothetical protein
MLKRIRLVRHTSEQLCSIASFKFSASEHDGPQPPEEKKLKRYN